MHIKRSIKGKDSIHSSENGNVSHIAKSLKPPIIRKGKLVVVDLAGSERIDKSGEFYSFSFGCRLLFLYVVSHTLEVE